MINRQLSGHLARSRVAIAAILACMQVACLGPMRHYSPPEDYVKGAAPPKVLVMLRDGTTLELTGPQVVLDTLLTGWTDRGTRFVGFTLSEVQRVSRREPSAGRTTLLAAGILTVVGTVAVLFGSNGTMPVACVDEEDECVPVP